MYKPDEKCINIEIMIWFNEKLGSKNARQRPFGFTMPLNFSTREVVQSVDITFDQQKVLEVIKIADYKQKKLNQNNSTNSEKLIEDLPKEFAPPVQAQQEEEEKINL